MQTRQDIPATVRRLAEQQATVVSREQALGLGMGRHCLDRVIRTQWRTLTPGVYLTLPTVPDWEALAWAGVLIGGDEARLGGRAAAHLHGLGPESTPIEVLVPWSTRPRPAGCWSFRRERPGARAARSVGSPPRTTVEDTVLDLCDEGGPADAVGWVTAAVQHRLTTPQRLRRAAAARPRLRHRRLLADLFVDVDEGAESPLELAYLRDVERAHGLPRGRRQVSRLAYCSDVSYDDHGVLVELDGRLGHSGSGRFRDMARDNAFVLSGRATLRYGWGDVTRSPCGVSAQVAGLLVARGWGGVPSRCVRCARIVDV